MARYPIFANDYAGIGALLANDEVRQQQAIQQAQQNFMRAQENQQQQQNYERKMAYQQAMDQQALARQAMLDRENSRYMDWQMSPAGANARMPAASRSALLKEHLNYVLQHGKVPEGVDPQDAAELEPVAKSVRPELAQRHELLTGASEVVNRRNALKLAIQRLESGIGAEPKQQSILFPEYGRKGTADITKRLRSLRDKYVNELSGIEPQARLVESDPMFAEGLQLDPRTRSFRPAYIPEFMNTNAPPAPRGTNAPTARAAVSQPASQAATGKFPPAFYQAVNALISQGVPPAEAKRQVMAQMAP